MAGKFIYRNAFVTNLQAWNEDSTLVYLITKEEGLFLSLWKRKTQKRIGVEEQPQLFSQVYCGLQVRSENNYRMRSFETLDYLSTLPFSSKKYLYFSYLSRLTRLQDEELSGNHSAFPIWNQVLKKEPTKESALLELLLDMLFINGLWFSLQHCEQCQVKTNTFHFENGNLQCSNCAQHYHTKLTNVLRNHLRSRYLNSVELPDLKRGFLMHLENMCLKRLSERFIYDELLKKCQLRWHEHFNTVNIS